MRKTIPPLFLLASVFVWVACDTEQPTAPGDVEASFIIGDAAHGDYQFENFYWLPPMVPQPTTEGTFEGRLFPVVKILEVQEFTDPTVPEAGICPADEEADLTFERYSGPAGHRVGVDVHGQHYHLNWDTDEVPLGPGDYRISVCLGHARIGFADVRVGATGKDFKNLNTDEVLKLIDGRVLPIKFRIEEEILRFFDFDISYHSDRDGDLDVYLRDLETGTDLNLTANTGILDGTANWHPTESKIIFTSDRANPGGHPHLYTMNFDGTTEFGTDVQPLGAGLIEGWQAEYSPGGLKIVFQRGWPPKPEWPNSGCDLNDETSPCGREHDIWIMDADGSNQIQLTDVPFDIGGNGWDWIDLYEDWSPTWDPTGNWVTFGRSRGGSDYEEHVPGWLDCDGYTIPYWMDEVQFWTNKRNFCAFDVVSIDVSTLDPTTPWFARPWIRHTYDLGTDQLGPKWSPEGVLTFKQDVDDGFIVALPNGPFSHDPGFTPPSPPIPNQWQGALHRDLTGSDQSGDLSWSFTTDRVFFGSEISGDLGVYSVDDWDAWLSSGVSYLQSHLEPLVVEEGMRNDWARFRPGH